MRHSHTSLCSRMCPHIQYVSASVTGIDNYVADTQILFECGTIGTTSDLDGFFSLSNTEGLITLQVQMVGGQYGCVIQINVIPLVLTYCNLYYSYSNPIWQLASFLSVYHCHNLTNRCAASY